MSKKYALLSFIRSGNTYQTFSICREDGDVCIVNAMKQISKKYQSTIIPIFFEKISEEQALEFKKLDDLKGVWKDDIN